MTKRFTWNTAMELLTTKIKENNKSQEIIEKFKRKMEKR